MMDSSQVAAASRVSRRVQWVAFYLMGFVTCFVILAAPVAYFGYQLGLSTLWARAPRLVSPLFDSRRLPLAADLLAELTTVRAVIDNADNPTRQPRHDTIL